MHGWCLIVYKHMQIVALCSIAACASDYWTNSHILAAVKSHEAAVICFSIWLIVDVNDWHLYTYFNSVTMQNYTLHILNTMHLLHFSNRCQHETQDVIRRDALQKKRSKYYISLKIPQLPSHKKAMCKRTCLRNAEKWSFFFFAEKDYFYNWKKNA